MFKPFPSLQKTLKSWIRDKIPTVDFCLMVGGNGISYIVQFLLCIFSPPDSTLEEF